MIITKKYSILLLDPPWSYKSRSYHKSKHRGGAIGHYPLLSYKDLWDLEPAAISTDNAVMFLWATYPLMSEQIDLMNHWGFTYKTAAFTWIKFNKKANSLFFGVGRYTRSNPEVVLLGVRGESLEIADKSVSSVVTARIGKHSEKPDEVRRRIERLYPNLPKIELFATKRVEGWDTYGLSLDGQDVRDYVKPYKGIFRL